MRRIANVAAVAAAITLAVVIPCQAQSLTGKWLGEVGATQGGGSIGLDLTASESTLTGTVIVIRGSQSFPLTVREASLTGSTFTIRVGTGSEGAAFSGEYSGDQIILRTLSADGVTVPIVLKRVNAFPDATASQPATTAPASAPPGWRAHNRAATSVNEGGRQIVRVDARMGDGVIWQDGTSFRDGTIDLDLRGSNRQGQSFVGIAFRGADDTTYDAIYFRPFNFRAPEPGKLRAIQYVSHPDHPWARLRAEHPGQYESAITPVPDPDDWFRARIVVDGATVRVFVDNATTPTLTVNTVSGPRGGMIGFWVGNGSSGDFANLRVMPK